MQTALKISSDFLRLSQKQFVKWRHFDKFEIVAFKARPLACRSHHAASQGRDQGASFTIELPLSPVKNKDFLPKKKLSANLLPTQNKGIRILLVEDHEPTRNALANLLTRRQYKILAAGSIAEARKIAAKEKIDFVISGIGLPDGSGNDLMTELCQRYALKGIALTGYGMENDVQGSLAAGFVAHLTKRVRIQALEKVLAFPMST